MMECRKLLSKIKWDKEFGSGKFKLGFLDRKSDELVFVSFEELFFPEGNSFSFQVTGKDGAVRNIPYHRIREIHKDGKMIWRRS